MKKTTMSTQTAKMGKLLALIAAALLTLALSCGCASDNAANNASSSSAAAEQQSAAPTDEIAITVTVTGNQGDININESVDINVQAGITALDALQLVCSDVTVEDGEYGPFVTSVNGIANAEQSGWIYTIDYDYVPESADAYTLSDGDIVTWSYYTN